MFLLWLFVTWQSRDFCERFLIFFPLFYLWNELCATIRAPAVWAPNSSIGPLMPSNCFSCITFILCPSHSTRAIIPALPQYRLCFYFFGVPEASEFVFVFREKPNICMLHPKVKKKKIQDFFSFFSCPQPLRDDANSWACTLSPKAEELPCLSPGFVS